MRRRRLTVRRRCRSKVLRLIQVAGAALTWLRSGLNGERQRKSSLPNSHRPHADRVIGPEFTQAVQELPGPRPLILHLSDADYFDSAGFAALDRLLAQKTIVLVIAPDSMLFKAAELTVQAVVTKDVNGKIGWKILEFGAKYDSQTTQSITLKLTPQWRQADGTLTTNFTIASDTAAGAHFGPEE
jgi:hypothetical protein